MRQVLISAALVSAASMAGAQERVVAHGPAVPAGTMGVRHHHDWGGRSGGYWTGGMRAPGGYRAYHRPVRGYAVPNYWLSPGFLIDDWAAYGLPRPFGPYHWSRYYDDAVLIDDRGSVYDSVEGVDWDRADRAAEEGAHGAGAGYPPPPLGAAYPAPGGYPHRDMGASGTLSGYAIDRGAERRRERMAPPYGAGYPPPPPGGYAHGAYPPPPYPPAPGYRGGPGGTTTTVTTMSGGYAGNGGTWVNGVYYGPGVTTVTVQSAPVITTTTTETIEDSVTYTRPAARRVYVKRAWHPHGKLQCRCGR